MDLNSPLIFFNHEGTKGTKKHEDEENYKQKVSGTLRFKVLYYVVRSKMTLMGYDD
jgi:hypothetical protein